jgi:hypothetical protein
VATIQSPPSLVANPVLHLGPQEYPHRPTHVFPAHFVLTHAHLGKTSRSVTHCSRSSTLNVGVFGDGLPEKKLQLIGMSILSKPIMPWDRMSYTPPLRALGQDVI